MTTLKPGQVLTVGDTRVRNGRVRFKADEKRNADPWSWQEKPLDAVSAQWAEQEPVYAPAIAKGGDV